MRKSEIDDFVKIRKKYVSHVNAIGIIGADWWVHVADAREVAKLVKTEVKSVHNPDTQYPYEYQTTYKGVLFLSVHEGA